MPLALTCDCGARFELEDALAGQEVRCPECQAKLTAPAAKKPVLRTSHFALASAVLALAGAFTAVGGVAAVVLGGVAVLFILRDRRRVAGLAFALFGIGAGAVFTALTPLALSSEGWGLGPALRRLWVADQLDAEPPDPKAPLNVKDKEFVLAKPSDKWAKAKAPKEFQDPRVQPLLKDSKVLVLQPESYAFVDVQTDTNAGVEDSKVYSQYGPLGQAVAKHLIDKDELPDPKKAPGNAADYDENGEPRKPAKHLASPAISRTKILQTGDGDMEAAEFEVDVAVDGRPWKMLVQVYHRIRAAKFFIVRGFTEKARFEHVKDELRKAVESFKPAP